MNASHASANNEPQRIRLQRYLAQCGVASRRAAEHLIVQGRVRVNGQTADQLGTTINPTRDAVEVDGRPVKPQVLHYIAAYKPRGCLCTARDPQGRRTLLDILIKTPGFPSARLFTVGRLDYASEGLLLLTNDGTWAQQIAHPRFGIQKTYHVWLSKTLSPLELAQFRKGIVTPDGERLSARHIHPLQTASGPACYEIVLTEGHYRHIRRMFEALDISVKRLLRIRIGPLFLGSLRPGRWRRLSPREIRVLARSSVPTSARNGERRSSP